MKKLFNIIVILLMMVLILSGCDNKMDIDIEGGATLNSGKYELKVISNTDGLSLSLTEEEYQKLLESKEESIYIPGLSPSAHDTFNSINDVTNASLWYFGVSDNTDSSEMNPNSKKYFESIDELINNKNGQHFAFIYEFIINVSEELGDIKLSIDEIILPENNIVSIILIGPDGFQERESDGDVVSEGVLANKIVAGSSEKLTLVLYVNGNDENCTTSKIEKYNASSSQFVIKVNAEKIEN